MKKKYTLVGVDGNAFAIMAYVHNALVNEGMSNKVSEYYKAATASDYQHLLAVSQHYISKANGCI